MTNLHRQANPTKANSLRTIAALATLLAAVTLPASGQVLPGPDGPVEFIGLDQWSAGELFEAIQDVAPGQPFHACAVVMKQELGFAEAAAFVYRTPGDSYTVVVGVEDSARVRYRAVGAETVALPETWEALRVLATDSRNLRSLDEAARTIRSRRGFFDRIMTRLLFGRMGVDRETLRQIRELVDNATAEEDRRLAQEVLARDPSAASRAVATLVLGNFLEHDTSWHALAGSLIDPEPRVVRMASNVVRGLESGKLEPVDWSAAHSHLLALFDGTNPFATGDMLEVLVATDIAPELGRQLVRETPDLLLAHAGAEHERTREPAIAFLRAVSGEDFGSDVEAWRAWVGGQPDRP